MADRARVFQTILWERRIDRTVENLNENRSEDEMLRNLGFAFEFNQFFTLRNSVHLSSVIKKVDSF